MNYDSTCYKKERVMSRENLVKMILDIFYTLILYYNPVGFFVYGVSTLAG